MYIYLVQHGQAHSKDVDPDRHLTEQGRDDVKRIAAFIKHLELHVHAIWQSGKVRAEQTADILESAVIAEQGVIQHDDLAPNDPIDPVKQELTRIEGDIMIVGHLPFLSKLTSELVAGNVSADVAAFQQGAILCLQQAEDETWTVRWMITPELPRRSR